MESLAHRAPGTQDRAMTSSTPQNFIAQNFIGGRWQESRGGGTDPVLDPATGEVITEVASSNAADVDSAVAAAAEAFAGWAATAPGQRAAALLQLADAIEADADDLVAHREPERRQADRRRARRSGSSSTTCASSAGAAQLTRPRRRASTSAGYTSILRREPLGVAGLDRPVELPADDGGLEDRARAGRRQHRRAEAVGAHAAHRAAPRRARRRHLPAGRVQRRSPATASTAAPRSWPIRTSRSSRSPAR